MVDGNGEWKLELTFRGIGNSKYRNPQDQREMARERRNELTTKDKTGAEGGRGSYLVYRIRIIGSVMGAKLKGMFLV